MLLAITALLIMLWLVSVLILNITGTLVHVLILVAVMSYMLHQLRKAQMAR